jgi:hypothetical protein
MLPSLLGIGFLVIVQPFEKASPEILPVLPFSRGGELF